jgi:hypothetical protein
MIKDIKRSIEEKKKTEEATAAREAAAHQHASQ